MSVFKKTWFRVVLAFVLVIIVVYMLGPHPATPKYELAMPTVPADAVGLEQYIAAGEAAHHLKPNNEARIVWANDSTKAKTEYAIVYLHGFSASQEEGKPIHTNIANEYGCNLYLSRLSEHGIDTTEPMKNLTADGYWESAKQALAIGKQLGKKVILMGTSTGGTNALQLAAAYPNDVDAIILLSPNVAINNPSAWLLNKPWGKQIAEAVVGSKYVYGSDTTPLSKQYWYTKYPLDAAVALQELVSTSMTKATFEKVKQPALLLYYYKDEVHQDSTIKVSAALEMFSQLGSAIKEKKAIPNAGTHVIGSYIRSHDLLSVQQAIEDFMDRKLRLPKQSVVALQRAE